LKVQRNTPNAIGPAQAKPKPAEPAKTQGPQPTTQGWAAKGSSPVQRATQGGVAPAATNNVPKAGVRSAAFEAQLDRETQSRNVSGNKVEMLFDGVNSFAERKKMIEGAKESICFQTFIFNSDETGWELANQLAAKAKEGVEVRVIYDALGSGRADPKMFEMMKAAGVDVKAYGEKYKLWDINDRWHEKHLIVDGRASIQGGMNIANEYALGGSGKQIFSRGGKGSEAWRDADMKLQGPAVADTMKAFVRNWEEMGGELSAADRAKLFPTLEPVALRALGTVDQHGTAGQQALSRGTRADLGQLGQEAVEPRSGRLVGNRDFPETGRPRWLRRWGSRSAGDRKSRCFPLRDRA